MQAYGRISGSPRRPYQRSGVMGADTRIEWCDHTFNPLSEGLIGRPQLQPVGVDKPVASFAKSDAVSHVEAQIGMVRKAPDVVGVKVAAAIVPAVTTGKVVPRVNIVSPALQFSGGAKSPPLSTLAVNVAGSVLSARRVRSGRSADFCAGFRGVPLPLHRTRAALRSRAHLGAAFGGHLLSLHRRHEGRPAFDPRFADNFTSTEGLIGHG